MASYTGFYISLDRSKERRISVVQQLKTLGWDDRYQHFSAIDGNMVEHAAPPPDTAPSAGALGCWLSHESLLEEQTDAGKHLHIVEDDVVFHSSLGDFFEKFQSAEPDWDILCTDVYFHPPPRPEAIVNLAQTCQKNKASNHISASDMRGLKFTSTTSYFVNKNSIGKIAELLKGQWRLGTTIDIFYNQLVQAGQIKALYTMPFLTTVSDHGCDSTITERSPHQEVLTLQRQAFYVATDATDVYRQILNRKNVEAPNPYIGIYAETLKDMLLPTKQRSDS